MSDNQDSDLYNAVAGTTSMKFVVLVGKNVKVFGYWIWCRADDVNVLMAFARRV